MSPRQHDPTSVDPVVLGSCGTHLVEFYDCEAALETSMLAFLRPTHAEGACLVAATPQHREVVAAAAPEAVADGRIVLLDAAALVERLLHDGMPDPDAFATIIGGLVDAADVTAGPVRIYGEMVAVLWEQGNVAGAMALEDLWNELAAARPFALMCGYPAGFFSGAGAAAAFAQLCEQHTAVTLPADRHLTHLASAADGRAPVSWSFDSAVDTGGRARGLLRDLLAGWELAAPFDDAQLLATELINNAVLHAGTRLVVSIEHDDAGLRVEVADFGPGEFEPGDPALSDTHGCGLLLVDAVSPAWGTAAAEGAKSVWFELPAPTAG